MNSLMIAYSLIIVLWVAAFIAALIGKSPDGVLMAGVGTGIALAAAGSAIGGFVSDYINTKAQADTNEANKQIAEENRKWQSEENRKSRQWSQDMWNMNNAYNTPSAMAQRQREAGFNPYLVDSGGLGTGVSQTPTANTSSSAPQAPEMVAPRVGATANALGQLPNMVAQAYSAESEIAAVKANAANQRADAESRIIANSQELYRTYGREASQKYFNNSMRSLRGANADGSLFARRVEADVNIQEANASLAQTNAYIEKKYGEKRAQNVLAIQENTWNKISAEIGKMASDASVNPAKIKELISQYYRNCAEVGLMKKQGDKIVAETSTINALRNGLVKKLEIEANSMDLSYQNQYTEFVADEGVRGYLTSNDAKMNRAKSAKLNNNRFVKAVGTASGIARNWMPSFVVPITGNGTSSSSGFENTGVFESGSYE